MPKATEETVKDILDQAATAVIDHPAEGINLIAAHVHEDRRAVTLTMVLSNSPAAWIEYDAEQLDRLIELLQRIRARLR